MTRPILLLTTAAISITMLTAATTAQPAPPEPVTIEPLPADWSPPPRNAALLYYRAWLIGERLFPQFEEFDWNRDDPSMPPELTHWLENNQLFIEQLLRASAQPTADWAVEYERGFVVPLPHLHVMRLTVRVLSADARRLMDDGRPQEAAERLAAIYGCALNLRSDRWLISSLVGAAIVNLANTETNRTLDSGDLSPVALQTLAAAVGRFDMDDPFAMRAALVSEGRTMKYGGIGGSIPPQEMIKQTQAMYDEAASIWTSPDAPARLAELMSRVHEGEFGMMASIMAPALTSTHKADTQAKHALDETAHRLRDAIKGGPVPELPDPVAIAPLPLDWSPPASRNAALFYYRVWQNNELLDQFADLDWQPSDPSIPPQLATLLDDHQDAIGELLRAASQPTADWAVEYELGLDALLGHLGLMRRTARVLAADARRLMAEARTEDAAVRIAAMYSCAQHLRSDRVMISSLVSMSIASLAHDEVDRLIGTFKLSSSAKDTLLNAVSRFGSQDPFAVRATLVSEGRNLIYWLDPEIGPTHNEIGQAQSFFYEAANFWTTPDAPEHLVKLISRVHSGEFGRLARMLAPGLTEAHEADTQAQQALIETRQRLNNMLTHEPTSSPDTPQDP